jgi:hypothetical protein
VALSLLLQGDVYFAAIVGLGVAALAIARLFAPPATPPGRLARRLLVLAAGATVAAAPFVLQRAAELPDIPRRLGVFPVARSSPLFLTGVGGPPRSVFIVAALVAAFGLALWLARPDPSLPAKRLPAALIALMLGGYFALPASTVVLGQAVQIYHFVEAFEIVTTFAAVLCALWLLQWGWALASRRRGETLWPRRRWVIGLLVGVVIAGLWLQLATFHRARRFYAGHGRADMAPYNELISYRADARSLAQELARPRYAGALTAATFDQQFSTWWTVFADRLVFFPNPFASPLPDSFFEERVMAFCRLLGMTPEEFFGFLQKRRTLEWLAHYKYQASAAYTFAPLERYSAPETIVAGGKFAGWDLAIPIDELQRLTEAYADLPPDFGRDWRLDLVVLTNDRMFRGRAPDPARFALSYQNPTFRVYLRRAEATAPAQL